MGTSDRRERHRASLRREILEAASRLFVEEGHHGVTMRRIAARIEYSPTTIYLHFKDKNELLAAVCEETFAELGKKLERLQKTAGGPLACLRESLRSYVEFGLAHPSQYTVAFSGLSVEPGSPPFERTAGGGVVDLLRQAVRACVESGDIQAPDADVTARALWASVHGITSMSIAMGDHGAAGRLALVEHLIETLIGGLRTPGAVVRSQVTARSKKWDYFE